eukprot:m.13954 g.13954  ORF g.13954 m.13954 type:complete len:502 (-) comp9935_c0_seq1:150-1655(-)
MRPLMKVMLGTPVLLLFGIYFMTPSSTRSQVPVQHGQPQRLSEDTERHLLSVIEKSASRVRSADELIEGYTVELKEKKKQINQLRVTLEKIQAEIPKQDPPKEEPVAHKVAAPAKIIKPKGPPQMPQFGDPTGKTIMEKPNLETMAPIPVLVIACNRPTVSRALDEIIKLRPNAEKFPIFVSQDCMHDETANVIRTYAPADKGGVVLYQQPNQTDPMPPTATKKERKWVGYYKIARHYKYALTQIFEHEQKFDSVIIVEDDLDMSPDIFEYFTAGRNLLKADPTLFCVSAWNDNGKGRHVVDPEKLYRTDFFGGLGWMILRELWDDELKAKWTEKYWDDWMRVPEQRKGRSCIRPEIGRTTTFGEKGVSKGQFWKKYLKFIKLNDKKIDFTKKDLSYLLKANYDDDFMTKVYNFDELSQLQVETPGDLDRSKEYRLEYRDNNQFRRIAKSLKIMEDLKEGVPRTGYLGIVSLTYRQENAAESEALRIHVAPSKPWAGYQPE